jgi:methenyltetrahydrofolate cyclohydrolase
MEVSDMITLDSSLRAYLDALAEHSPVPGAGSTAALTAMLAAALGRMAVAFSATGDTPAEQEALREAADALSATQQRCETLMSDDMSGFARFVAARRDRTAAGSAALEGLARNAAATPLRIARASLAGLGAMQHGSRCIAEQVRADWAAAAQLFAAAAQSALLAAEASAAALPDPAEREELLAECRLLRQQISSAVSFLDT